MYLFLSVLVAVFTIISWRAIEHDMLNTPNGDLGYHDFKLGFSIVNYIFLPSVLLCIAYRLLCRVINFIFWR